MLQANLSDTTPRPDADSCDVRASQVADLVDNLVDPARQRPVLVITPAGTRNGPRIDASRLPPEARRIADVRILTSTAAVLRLSELLPKPLRVFGGAGRIYWPHLSLAHGPQQHPVILAFSDTDPTEPLRRIAAELTTWHPDPVIEPQGGKRLEIRALKLRRLHRDLTRERETTVQAIQRADSAEQREQQLTTQLEQLQAQYDDLTATPPPLFADPVRQLRHDLHLMWLRTVPEPEREHTPLRHFTAGRDLIDSMSIQLATRDRIIRVMVDVLTGAVHTHPGRATHRQRINAGGGSHSLTRADGATAWRCSLKSNTPAAPRLLWWQLRDGTIELDRVLRHE